MGGRGGASHRTISGGVNNGNTPVTLQQFDARERRIREEMIRRYNLSPEDVKYIEGQLARLIAENDFGRFITWKRTEDIIDSYFKNQQETRTSQGLTNVTRRTELSAKLFGHPYSTVGSAPPEIYEKYGALVPKDIVKAMYANASGYSGWGSNSTTVLVRFKKDALMDRTTFLTADSLNYENDVYNNITSRVNRPSITGIIDYDSSSWMSNPFRSDIVNTIKQAESYINSPDKWVGKVNGGEYLELQYHGYLGMEHVESFTFSFTGSEPPGFDRIVKKLKKKNIKVYKVEGKTYREL